MGCGIGVAAKNRDWFRAEQRAEPHQLAKGLHRL